MFKTILKTKPQFFHFMILIIVVLAIGIRLAPGKDHTLWIYEQARDATVAESIFRDHNVVLRGPQTEFPGLSHGPLFYWFAAPWYFLSQGDPNLPTFAFIVANVSTLLPLGLLSWTLWRSKTTTLTVLILFAVAYEQTEYSRWISNVSLAIPCITAFWFFLWKTWSQSNVSYKYFFGAGITLGLTIQSELFFLIWIPAWLGIGMYRRFSLKQILVWLLGLGMSISPLLLAEIKFHFLGAQLFVTEILLRRVQTSFDVGAITSAIFSQYYRTLSQTILGDWIVGQILFSLLFIVIIVKSRSRSNTSRRLFLLLLTLIHLLLYMIQHVNAVFMTVTVGITILLWTGEALYNLRTHNKILLLIVSSFVIFQLMLGYKNVQRGTPFGPGQTIQTGVLYKQKMEILHLAKELAMKSSTLPDITFASLGPPYRVRTMWAGLWRQETRRFGGTMPKWFGLNANGFPDEQRLIVTDHPGQFHILIIESNPELLSTQAKTEFLLNQDEATTVIQQIEKYGYVIQIRKRK